LTKVRRFARFAGVSSLLLLIRDSALGLAVMIVGVVVLAVVTAPLPRNVLYGCTGALIIFGWIQRFRRWRRER
jgi:hypothetical protein